MAGPPVEPYRVDVCLSEGDQIDAGGVRSRFSHPWAHPGPPLPVGARGAGTDPGRRRPPMTWPGSTPTARVPGAMGRAMEESVERLAGLKARWACSGRGPAVVEPEEGTGRRPGALRGVAEEAESAAWHACKRIAAYALMIRDGLAEGGDRPLRLPPRGRPASRATLRPTQVRPGPDRAASFGGRQAERRAAAGGLRPAQPAPTRLAPAYPWPGNCPSTNRLGGRPKGAVAGISEISRKEKCERARGPADRILQWARVSLSGCGRASPARASSAAGSGGRRGGRGHVRHRGALSPRGSPAAELLPRGCHGCHSRHRRQVRGDDARAARPRGTPVEYKVNFLAPARGEKLVAGSGGDVRPPLVRLPSRGVRRRGAGQARVRGRAADGFACARAGSGPEARSLRTRRR